MIRYAITSGLLLPGDPAGVTALEQHAVHLATSGVDFLQVREKALPFAEAAALAARLHHATRLPGARLRVLLNAPWPAHRAAWPAEVGLHLAATSLADVAALSPRASALPTLVSASAHSLAEAAVASRFASVLLFAPVFEKRVHGQQVSPGRGLAALAEVCRAVPVPVLALGGVTAATTAACLAAGAAGVAGIRLFLQGSAS